MPLVNMKPLLRDAMDRGYAVAAFNLVDYGTTKAMVAAAEELNASIAENVRYVCPHATDAEVSAALEAAGVARFVFSLPQGDRTMVGDRGLALSAGERQRLALARAFLSDAPLVVLDEPTANLDPATAAVVGDAIDRLSDERAVLLIAHRPELAARADRIVRLEQGRLVEEVTAR